MIGIPRNLAWCSNCFAFNELSTFSLPEERNRKKGGFGKCRNTFLVKREKKVGGKEGADKKN